MSRKFPNLMKIYLKKCNIFPTSQLLNKINHQVSKVHFSSYAIHEGDPLAPVILTTQGKRDTFLWGKWKPIPSTITKPD